MIITINLELIITIIINSIIANENNPVVKTNLRKKNLSSHGNNVVLAINIPYMKDQVVEEMENNLKITYNNTNKVCRAVL